MADATPQVLVPGVESLMNARKKFTHEVLGKIESYFVNNSDLFIFDDNNKSRQFETTPLLKFFTKKISTKLSQESKIYKDFVQNTIFSKGVVEKILSTFGSSKDSSHNSLPKNLKIIKIDQSTSEEELKVRFGEGKYLRLKWDSRSNMFVTNDEFNSPGNIVEPSDKGIFINDEILSSKKLQELPNGGQVEISFGKQDVFLNKYKEIIETMYSNFPKLKLSIKNMLKKNENDDSSLEILTETKFDILRKDIDKMGKEVLEHETMSLINIKMIDRVNQTEKKVDGLESEIGKGFLFLGDEVSLILNQSNELITDKEGLKESLLKLGNALEDQQVGIVPVFFGRNTENNVGHFVSLVLKKTQDKVLCFYHDSFGERFYPYHKNALFEVLRKSFGDDSIIELSSKNQIQFDTVSCGMISPCVNEIIVKKLLAPEIQKEGNNFDKIKHMIQEDIYKVFSGEEAEYNSKEVSSLVEWSYELLGCEDELAGNFVDFGGE